MEFQGKAKRKTAKYTKTERRDADNMVVYASAKGVDYVKRRDAAGALVYAKASSGAKADKANKANNAKAKAKAKAKAGRKKAHVMHGGDGELAAFGAAIGVEPLVDLGPYHDSTWEAFLAMLEGSESKKVSKGSLDVTANDVLIAIDMQSDFCAETTEEGDDGTRYKPKLATPSARSVPGTIAKVMGLGTSGKILLTQDWHTDGHISFAGCDV
jgi:hypothetical protein